MYLQGRQGSTLSGRRREDTPCGYQVHGVSLVLCTPHLAVSRHGAICVSVLVSELPDTLHLIIKLSTSRLQAQKKVDSRPKLTLYKPHKSDLFPDFSLVKSYFAPL